MDRLMAIDYLVQGTLTEGEGLERVISSLRFFSKKSIMFGLSKEACLNKEIYCTEPFPAARVPCLVLPS
jgi:hypothetical protein